MKSRSTAQCQPVELRAPDPVVEVGQEIQRLWNAYRGVEMQAWSVPTDRPADKRRLEECGTQILEHLNAMEVVASFTIATSLEGALIHLAMIDGIAASINNDQEKGEIEKDVEKMRRLLRSAGDAVADALGGRLDAVRTTVTTYSWFGDRKQPNWLGRVDEWAEIGRIEKETEARQIDS